MSDDPVRFVDDASAPPALRGDLARAATAAPSFEVEAGLARLSAAIAVIPAGPTTGSPPAAGGAATQGGAAGKAALGGAKAAGLLSKPMLVALAVVGAGAVGGGAYWSSASRVVPAATTSAPAEEPRVPFAVQPKPLPVATAAPDVPTPPEPRAEEAKSAAPHAAPPPSASPDDLALEMEDLVALRAEAASDPGRAVEHAAASARRFPRGQFGIEREAIAIQALATAGRSGDARPRAEAFLAAHPQSTFAEQVKRAGGL